MIVQKLKYKPIGLIYLQNDTTIEMTVMIFENISIGVILGTFIWIMTRVYKYSLWFTFGVLIAALYVYSIIITHFDDFVTDSTAFGHHGDYDEMYALGEY